MIALDPTMQPHLQILNLVASAECLCHAKVTGIERLWVGGGVAFHLRESVLMDLGGISGPHMPRSRERRTGHQERVRGITCVIQGRKSSR